MDTLTQQLIASFFIGGALVALQAYAAEKVPKQVSGIVLALPSTIIVNYFFLAYILSPSEFQQMLPAIPAPLGFSLIFITSYIYIAKWLYTFSCKPKNWFEAIKQTFVKVKLSKIKKITLISLSSILAISIWLLLSLPLAINQFNNLTLSLLIFLVLAFVNYKLMNRGSNKYSAKKLVKYKSIQQIARASFAGLMVSVTVYLGATLGPFWAGVTAMFPAAFLASICIIHYYYDHVALFGFFRTTPIGISTLIVYALMADWSFPIYGVVIGTLLSILASLIYSWFLSKLNKN